MSYTNLTFLMREVARRNPQSAMAALLNEHGYYQENGAPWTQPAISQYCAKYGIQPFAEYRGRTFKEVYHSTWPDGYDKGNL